MKPETFCDNCADVINLKDAVIFKACPFPTASTSAGESATLCPSCARRRLSFPPMENQNTPAPSGTSPGAASAGSGQPSPVRLVYGSLSCVPTCDLIAELLRRQSGHGDFTGDIEPCVVFALTPSDLSEYWESDDAGNTSPASRIPEPEEWPAIVRAFYRWQDTGGFHDIMHTLRDAWQAEQARQLDTETEGGSK